MRTECQPIRLYRNADYHEGWQLCDQEGVQLDLTFCDLALAIRYVAGQGTILARAVIDLYDPANGLFTVHIDGSALTAVPGATEVVRLAYDLRLTYHDGVQFIPVAGQVLLTPGVTY